MPDIKTIAVVGGGPAGAFFAATLAAAGKRIILFEEKSAWEKPCGGGITHKALTLWPFLADAQVQRNWVRECELISPSGRRVSFPLKDPVAIFSRRVLNGLLLERARQAGADIRCERVVGVEEWDKAWRIAAGGTNCEADYLVIAAGARTKFRSQFSAPLAPEDLMATCGYYIPARSDLMQIQFLAGLHGYIWIFPRADHYSAGICGKLRDNNTAALRRLLEQSLRELRVDFRGAQFYAHVLPSLRASSLRRLSVRGPDWAMIGDAAGFVDSITGEGLYYALRSAELLSQSVLSGKPESYPARLREDFLPELEVAARIADRFYTGRWMGEGVIERMVQFTSHSGSFRALMSDMFAGTQGYADLRRRLYRTLPAMLAESLASALRLPSARSEVRPGSSLERTG